MSRERAPDSVPESLAGPPHGACNWGRWRLRGPGLLGLAWSGPASALGESAVAALPSVAAGPWLSGLAFAALAAGWGLWRWRRDSRQKGARFQQAKADLRLAASVFSNMQEGIVIVDPERRIVEVNQAFTRLTGYAREEALGRDPGFLDSARHSPEFHAELWRAAREEGTWRGEVWSRRKNGAVYPQWLSLSAVTDAAGRLLHYIAAFSDISLLKQHEQRLEYMAYYDALTGIPNRVLLRDRILQGIAQVRRHGGLLAVCYLDLDGFKPVNDRFGHEVGDVVLVEMAHRIKDGLREGDTVARLGGDEFIVLLRDLVRPEDCSLVLRRMLERVAEPVQVEGRRLSLSVSAGVSLFPIDDSDPDTLLRHADQAMFQAKQAGKNRVQVFDPQANTRALSRQAALTRFGLALDRGELFLMYQPKVDLRTGRVVGAEALARWHDPERGLVPPTEFVALLEGHPLSRRLDQWVMEEALRQATEWGGQGFELAVSVNVTAQSLQAPGFSEELAELLSRYPKVEPGRYEIEILESTALDDIDSVSEAMRRCQRLGVRFALDDFGTGYSSLTYLKRLPAEALKIDQSFIRDMLEDQEALAIVKGVIGLAQAFHREAVAEGVETPDHGARLLSLGYHVAQGYGIARPMPGAELPGWAANWRTPEAWRLAGSAD
jgi:diguanylate cyclase (GGDEF)-like protein/PAS domain S-box-containing protein